MGLFGNILKRQIRKELEQYVNFISVGSDQEMANTLMGANLLRKQMLDSSNLLSGVLDGTNPFIYELEDKGNKSEKIAFIRTEMIDMRKELDRAGNRNTIGELNVWLMTLKGLIDMDTYILVKRMWRDISRGIPLVEANIKENENKLTEWSRQNLTYIPEMFRQ